MQTVAAELFGSAGKPPALFRATARRAVAKLRDVIFVS
jgi:hypothetical protein